MKWPLRYENFQLNYYFSSSLPCNIYIIFNIYASCENIIYSHRMTFLYNFKNFIQVHLRLKKNLIFYRQQNWKKIVRPRVKFCPQTGASPLISSKLSSLRFFLFFNFFFCLCFQILTLKRTSRAWFSIYWGASIINVTVYKICWLPSLIFRC